MFKLKSFLVVIFLMHNMLLHTNSATIKEHIELELTDCENSDHKELCATMTTHSNRINKFKVISAPTIRISTRPINDMELCKSETFLISPITGITRNNKVILLGNSSNIESLVKVEVCTQPNADCQIPGELANGVKTICVQHYTERELVIVSREKKQLPEKLFSLPSGCNCEIVKQN